MSNLTDYALPRLPLLRLAEDIFRAPYALSVAVLPPKRATILNAKYRNKSYSPNVLSFPLSATEGEIILNIVEAKKQFDDGAVDGTWSSWVALLVIHSMLHLNGMRHGITMERRLNTLLKKHGFRARLLNPKHHHDTTHHYRH